MDVVKGIKSGELTVVVYEGLMQVRNVIAEKELLRIIGKMHDLNEYISVWEVYQTTDGYNYDESPCIASFVDYEKAVEFLYTDNVKNEKNLGIINRLRMKSEEDQA